MGLPKDSSAPYRDTTADDGASMSSAVSLQENIGFDHDDDSDDNLPPPYSDETVPLTTGYQPDFAPADLDTEIEYWRSTNHKGSRYTRLSPTLTTDPEALQKYIEWESRQVPQAFIQIKGTHSETRRESGNKTKQEQVCDFDFKIEVTETFSGRQAQPWNYISIAPDTAKAYRGSRLKWRKQKVDSMRDTEAQEAIQNLKECCHLFCASATPLKTFTLRRQICNRDEKLLTELIIAAIRDTHYRGSISVGFSLHDRSVTIMSPHPFNRWRNNPWIWWPVVLLQLWVITWPVLFLMTRRWETVFANWDYAKLRADRSESIYWLQSELAWAENWCATIQQNALSRSKGCEAVRLAPTADIERLNMQRQQEAAASSLLGSRGNGVLGNAFAIARGVANVVSANPDSMGWGYNT